jgi:sulfite reductase (ferredoxin)
MAIGAIPSKRIPDVVTRITDRYVKDRNKGESFQEYAQRVGKKVLKEALDDLAAVPAYEEDASFYSDWGDPREFTIGDMGVGECAGEVVSLVEFDMAAAERLVFEAQLHLEAKDYQKADETAYAAMLQGAKALIRTEFLDVGDDPDQIVAEFRKRFYDTQLFFDKYAGGKFGAYLLRRHEDRERAFTREGAHELVDEAHLFVEACHACHARLMARPAAKATVSSVVTLGGGPA